MNNDNNNDLPSIDDVLKDYEKRTPLQTQPVEEPVQEPITQEAVQNNIESASSEGVTTVNNMGRYNVNGKSYNSLTEMLEEQEQAHKEKEALYRAQNPSRNVDEYLKHYIGNNYESFENGGISFAYFFFGEYYLIFRKMYVPAIIKYILTIGALFLAIYSYVLGNYNLVYISIIAYILIQILPIFFVKSFYFNYAKEKVQQIINENQDKSEDELIKICSEKGGTSIIAVVVLIVLLYVVRLIIPKPNINDDSVKINDYSKNNLDTYKINVRDLTTLSTEYLGFQRTEFMNQTVIKKSECMVKINTKSLAEGYTIDTGGVEEEMIDINGHEWRHLIDDNKNAYIIEYNEYLYTIETVDYEVNTKCPKSIDILVKNLNFK